MPQGKSDETFTRKVSGILNSGFTMGRSTAAQAVNKVENRKRSANSFDLFSYRILRFTLAVEAFQMLRRNPVEGIQY